MKRQYNEAMDRVHMSNVCAQRILEQAASDCKGGNVMRFGNKVKKAAIAVAMVAVLSSVAFAADVGGIRTTAMMWVRGEQQSVEIVRNEDGVYEGKTEDGGEFGGVGFDADGNTVEMSAEDFEEELAIDVQQGDDGTWTLYFYDQTIDITEDMKNGGYDGTLTRDGNDYHIAVDRDGSFSVEQTEAGGEE